MKQWTKVILNQCVISKKSPHVNLKKLTYVNLKKSPHVNLKKLSHVNLKKLTYGTSKKYGPKFHKCYDGDNVTDVNRHCRH